MARRRRPGRGRRRRRPARAGRGRLARRLGPAGLPRPWRGAPPRPALQGSTRRWGPASPGSPPRRRRRTRAGQGRAPPPQRTPTRRDPTPRRGSRDRRKSAASGPMAQGLGVRPTAGPRQAGRAGRGRLRPNGRFARRFPTPRRRLQRPSLRAPSGARPRGPPGRISRRFPSLPSRLPNHVR